MRYLPAAAVAILAAVFACATPEPVPTQYDRGTLVRPPPPPVRPGHGAPAVGQPGVTVAPLPRSPHKRPLPPTAEPGIWAGDGPKAATKPTGAVLALWGYALPLPPDPEPVEKDRVERCANTILKSVISANASDELATLSRKELHCPLATLNLMCAEHGTVRAKAAPDEEPALWWRNILVAARDDKAQKCDGLKRSLSGREMEEVMTRHMGNALKEMPGR
jgi:hypothetical protein